jgi:hypothetical protein
MAPKKQYTKTLPVGMDDFEHAYITKVARERGCSMAEVIRRMIENEMLAKWQQTQKLPMQ